MVAGLPAIVGDEGQVGSAVSVDLGLAGVGPAQQLLGEDPGLDSARERSTSSAAVSSGVLPMASRYWRTGSSTWSGRWVLTARLLGVVTGMVVPRSWVVASEVCTQPPADVRVTARTGVQMS